MRLWIVVVRAYAMLVHPFIHMVGLISPMHGAVVVHRRWHIDWHSGMHEFNHMGVQTTKCAALQSSAPICG